MNELREKARQFAISKMTEERAKLYQLWNNSGRPIEHPFIDCLLSDFIQSQPIDEELEDTSSLEEELENLTEENLNLTNRVREQEAVIKNQERLLKRSNIEVSESRVRSDKKVVMRVFEFEGEETDWVVAESRESAEEFYMNHAGIKSLEGFKVSEVEDLDNHFVLDVNVYCDDIPEEEEHLYFNGYRIEMTFKECAEKAKSRDIIATTNF